MGLIPVHSKDSAIIYGPWQIRSMSCQVDVLEQGQFRIYLWIKITETGHNSGCVIFFRATGNPNIYIAKWCEVRFIKVEKCD